MYGMYGKRLAGLLAATLLTAGLLAGCGGGGSQQAAQPVDLIFATGGTGGTYYPLGGGIAKVWKDNIPGLNVTVQSTGASVANIRALGKKEADLALIQNDTAEYGRTGQAAFAEQNEKYTNYLAIAALYPEVVQFVVRADSAIQSIEDLRGKRVVVGAAGSGTELNARQILGAYGLDYKDRTDLEPLYLSFAEGAAAMKEKQADALIIVSGVPNASLADLQTVTDIRLLPIEAARVQQEFPFFAKYTVKANTYKGISQAVDVVALQATLVIRDEIDADLVYQMTRVLFEKAGDIGHAKAKEFDIKKAADGVTIPFHPGAAKYLQEQGVNVK